MTNIQNLNPHPNEMDHKHCNYEFFVMFQNKTYFLDYNYVFIRCDIRYSFMQIYNRPKKNIFLVVLASC